MSSFWWVPTFKGRSVASVVVVVGALAALLLPQPARGLVELVLGLGAPLVAFSYCLPAGKPGRAGFALLMTLGSWCLLALVVYLCGLHPSGPSSVLILALILAGALALERLTSPRAAAAAPAAAPPPSA